MVDLDTRYFLTWSETAQALGMDDEGLRQAMLMRFSGAPGAAWLPVGIDSQGADFLAHLVVDGSNPIVSDAQVGEWHGVDEDVVFADGTVFPNHGRTESASWDATHDHRTGWSNCFHLGGRLVLDPNCVRQACEIGGDLTRRVLTVVPREWCKPLFPNGAFSFCLTEASAGFRKLPEHLYTQTFFYAEDVRNVRDKHPVKIKATRDPEPSEQMDTRKLRNMLRMIRALEVMANLPPRGATSALELQLQKLGFTSPKEATIRNLLLEARNLEADEKPQ